MLFTLERSSSFSPPTSSPASSSRKGFVGSRGLSGFFFCKRSLKLILQLNSHLFHCLTVTSIIVLTVTSTLHMTPDPNEDAPDKVCLLHVSYPWCISQSASCEALGQQTLKVCGSLNGKEQQFHFNLLCSCSHNFCQFHSKKKNKFNFLQRLYTQITLQQRGFVFTL